MSENKNNTVVKTSGGIGFVGLLTILFVGLKLTGFIDWSWVWVLSPLWITPVAVIGIYLFVILISIFIAVISTVISNNKKNKK